MYIFPTFLSDQIIQTTRNISRQKAYFFLKILVVVLFSEDVGCFFRIQCLVTI